MSTVETNSAVHHDQENGIHFSPPLYRQRYMFTLDYIEQDPTLHSLFDIGCGTGQLLTIGKYRTRHIQLVAAIDIVRYELDEAYFRLKPLSVEYMMFRRETPLHLYILHGDATRTCPCFHHFDVVTLIEVIEHLYLNDLNNLVEHVFGHMRPRLVIVTTPNADFNVLFPTMISGQFRHADHKFEFSRPEFQNWSSQIVQKYMYKVEFHGVGEAPLHEQYRNIGTCTQIAVFHRLDDNHRHLLSSSEFSQRLSQCQQHELLFFIDYPFGITKTNELQDQIRYILNMYRLMAMEKARLGHDEDPNTHDHLWLTIPSDTLLNHPRLKQLNITSKELKSIVETMGYKILDNNRIVLPNDNSHEDNHSDDDDIRHTTTDTHHFVTQNRLPNPSEEESWD